MAILRRCLCFDNVRTGSVAAGIYSVLYSIIFGGLIALLIFIQVLRKGSLIDFISTSPFGGVYIIYLISLASMVLILIASILLLKGVSQNQRGLLFPYLVGIPLVTLVHVAHIIQLLIYYCSKSYVKDHGHSTGTFFELSGMGMVTLLNIACILPVVSQFQELQAGRGRLEDVFTAGISTHTTLINTAAPISNTVVVTQQGGAPAVQNYGYPPQQGYPNPPPVGYPPQPAGYPPQPVGYPPQPAGYPPQPAGYPPQQDYPPEQPDPYAQRI